MEVKAVVANPAISVPYALTAKGEKWMARYHNNSHYGLEFARTGNNPHECMALERIFAELRVAQIVANSPPDRIVVDVGGNPSRTGKAFQLKGVGIHHSLPCVDVSDPSRASKMPDEDVSFCRHKFPSNEACICAPGEPCELARTFLFVHAAQDVEEFLHLLSYDDDCYFIMHIPEQPFGFAYEGECTYVWENDKLVMHAAGNAKPYVHGIAEWLRGGGVIDGHGRPWMVQHIDFGEMTKIIHVSRAGIEHEIKIPEVKSAPDEILPKLGGCMKGLWAKNHFAYAFLPEHGGYTDLRGTPVVVVDALVNKISSRPEGFSMDQSMSVLAALASVTFQEVPHLTRSHPCMSQDVAVAIVSVMGASRAIGVADAFVTTRALGRVAMAKADAFMPNVRAAYAAYRAGSWEVALRTLVSARLLLALLFFFLAFLLYSPTAEVKPGPGGSTWLVPPGCDCGAYNVPLGTGGNVVSGIYVRWPGWTGLFGAINYFFFGKCACVLNECGWACTARQWWGTGVNAAQSAWDSATIPWMQHNLLGTWFSPVLEEVFSWYIPEARAGIFLFEFYNATAWAPAIVHLCFAAFMYFWDGALMSKLVLHFMYNLHPMVAICSAILVIRFVRQVEALVAWCKGQFGAGKRSVVAYRKRLAFLSGTDAVLPASKNFKEEPEQMDESVRVVHHALNVEREGQCALLAGVASAIPVLANTDGVGVVSAANGRMLAEVIGSVPAVVEEIKGNLPTITVGLFGVDVATPRLMQEVVDDCPPHNRLKYQRVLDSFKIVGDLNEGKEEAPLKSVFPKTEILAKSVLLKYIPRLISTYDDLFQLLGLTFERAMRKQIGRGGFRVYCASGLTAFDVGALYDQVMPTSWGVFWSDDIKRDMHFTRSIMQLMNIVFLSLGLPKHICDRVTGAIDKILSAHGLDVNCKLWRLGSGIFVTTFINTILMPIIHIHVLLENAMSVLDVIAEYWALVNGDDMVYGGSERVCGILELLSTEPYGFEQERHFAKTDDPAVLKADFLSGRFVPTARGTVLCPKIGRTLLKGNFATGSVRVFLTQKYEHVYRYARGVAQGNQAVFSHCPILRVLNQKILDLTTPYTARVFKNHSVWRAKEPLTRTNAFAFSKGWNASTFMEEVYGMSAAEVTYVENMIDDLVVDLNVILPHELVAPLFVGDDIPVPDPFLGNPGNNSVTRGAKLSRDIDDPAAYIAKILENFKEMVAKHREFVKNVEYPPLVASGTVPSSESVVRIDGDHKPEFGGRCESRDKDFQKLTGAMVASLSTCCGYNHAAWNGGRPVMDFGWVYKDVDYNQLKGTVYDLHNPRLKNIMRIMHAMSALPPMNGAEFHYAGYGSHSTTLSVVLSCIDKRYIPIIRAYDPEPSRDASALRDLGVNIYVKEYPHDMRPPKGSVFLSDCSIGSNGVDFPWELLKKFHFISMKQFLDYKSSETTVPAQAFTQMPWTSASSSEFVSYGKPHQVKYKTKDMEDILLSTLFGVRYAVFTTKNLKAPYSNAWCGCGECCLSLSIMHTFAHRFKTSLARIHDKLIGSRTIGFPTQLACGTRPKPTPQLAFEKVRYEFMAYPNQHAIAPLLSKFDFTPTDRSSELSSPSGDPIDFPEDEDEVKLNPQTLLPELPPEVEANVQHVLQLLVTEVAEDEAQVVTEKDDCKSPIVLEVGSKGDKGEKGAKGVKGVVVGPHLLLAPEPEYVPHNSMDVLCTAELPSLLLKPARDRWCRCPTHGTPPINRLVHFVADVKDALPSRGDRGDRGEKGEKGPPGGTFATPVGTNRERKTGSSSSSSSSSASSAAAATLATLASDRPPSTLHANFMVGNLLNGLAEHDSKFRVGPLRSWSVLADQICGRPCCFRRPSDVVCLACGHAMSCLRTRGLADTHRPLHMVDFCKNCQTTKPALFPTFMYVGATRVYRELPEIKLSCKYTWMHSTSAHFYLVPGEQFSASDFYRIMEAGCTVCPGAPKLAYCERCDFFYLQDREDVTCNHGTRKRKAAELETDLTDVTNRGSPGNVGEVGEKGEPGGPSDKRGLNLKFSDHSPSDITSTNLMSDAKSKVDRRRKAPAQERKTPALSQKAQGKKSSSQNFGKYVSLRSLQGSGKAERPVTLEKRFNKVLNKDAIAEGNFGRADLPNESSHNPQGYTMSEPTFGEKGAVNSALFGQALLFPEDNEPQRYPDVSPFPTVVGTISDFVQCLKRTTTDGKTDYWGLQIIPSVFAFKAQSTPIRADASAAFAFAGAGTIDSYTNFATNMYLYRVTGLSIMIEDAASVFNINGVVYIACLPNAYWNSATPALAASSTLFKIYSESDEGSNLRQSWLPMSDAPIDIGGGTASLQPTAFTMKLPTSGTTLDTSVGVFVQAPTSATTNDVWVRVVMHYEAIPLLVAQQLFNPKTVVSSPEAMSEAMQITQRMASNGDDMNKQSDVKSEQKEYKQTVSRVVDNSGSSSLLGDIGDFIEQGVQFVEDIPVIGDVLGFLGGLLFAADPHKIYAMHTMSVALGREQCSPYLLTNKHTAEAKFLDSIRVEDYALWLLKQPLRKDIVDDLDMITPYVLDLREFEESLHPKSSSAATSTSSGLVYIPKKI